MSRPDAERRPLVGILANTEVFDGVAHQAVRDVYVRSVADVAGCDVVVLPVGIPVSEALRRLDGVLLTGHQSNVHPDRYGSAPQDGAFDPDRDTTALSVIPWAVDAGIPLFAVCRGLQEMNVAYGGTLRPVPPGPVGHREDVSRPRDEQYLPKHTVSVVPGGVLHSVLAALEVRVNSLHGQAVEILAPSLRVEACAADQVVEAASVAEAKAFALGIQWHPEWYAGSDPVSRRLFEAFGDACRQYQRQTSSTSSVVRSTSLSVRKDR